MFHNPKEDKPRVMITLGILILFPFSFGLLSQEQVVSPKIPLRLTLDLATEMLLVSNPTILRERENLVMARARVTQARLRPNPELGIFSESYPLFESNPGPFFNGQELGIRIGQTLELGGKRRKRARVAKQDVAVTESLLKDTVRRAKLELQQRYFAVVLAKAERELAGEVLREFDEVIAINEVRYEKGEISGLELIRLQTERLRFFQDLRASELRLRTAKTAVLELLGVKEMAADFDVRERLEFRPFEATLPQLTEQATERRNDLEARRQQIQRERLQLRLEKAQRIPNLTPVFGYKRDFGENTALFGVNLPLPLFHRNQGGVRRLKARFVQAQHEFNRAELSVLREVHDAFQTVRNRAELAQALEADYVPKAKRARDIAQASYRLGALDLIAFLDAERTYRETLRAYHRALYDQQIAVFTLQAAVGGEIPR